MRTCSNCGEDKPLSRFEGRRHQCYDCRNIYFQELYARNPVKYRNKMRNYRHGITIEQAELYSQEQNNECKICGDQVVLVVDHCHTTGEYRGMLCSSCNKMLGFAKDNPTILVAGAEYLNAKA